MKSFSFWKTFLLSFLIMYIIIVLYFGFLGMFKEDAIEALEGILMVVFPLSIVLAFFVKWIIDFRQTRKIFVLIGGRCKFLQIIGLVLLLTTAGLVIYGTILYFEGVNKTIIDLDKWNFNGYYG